MTTVLILFQSRMQNCLYNMTNYVQFLLLTSFFLSLSHTSSRHTFSLTLLSFILLARKQTHKLIYTHTYTHKYTYIQSHAHTYIHTHNKHILNLHTQTLSHHLSVLHMFKRVAGTFSLSLSLLLRSFHSL